MEVEKEMAVSNQNQVFQRYSFLFTIISSMLISGLIGYTASQIVVNNSVGDLTEINTTITEINTTEINTMKNQVIEARNNSLEVIETEIPKIISDLDKYNQDINLLVKNVEWLNGNLTPIRDAIGKFDPAITAVRGVNNFVNLPFVSKASTDLALAQIQLNEIDSILFRLENLTVIKQEMSDSHQKLNLLFEEYQKEKSIEHLFQIEQELNSNLIYQIEDLRNSTIEAHKVLELSSSILITVNKTRSLFITIQEMGKDTLNAMQFWKENEGSSEIGADIKESLKKDLVASIEKIQKLPNELAQQSKSSITSISNVQKELQTIKIAQMIITE